MNVIIAKSELYGIIYTKNRRESAKMVYDFQSFYQEDLQLLRYRNMKVGHETKTDKEWFQIIVFIKGRPQILGNNIIYRAHEGDLLYLNYSEVYTISQVDDENDMLIVSFCPRIFQSIDEKNNVLSPFYDQRPIKIIKNALWMPHIRAALDNVFRALDLYASRTYAYSAALQLVCELAYERGEEKFTANVDTNNNYVRIVSYIENHLYEKITLKAISDNVFLSERCIQKTIKRIYGDTYHNMLMKMRLNHSRQIIEHSDSPISEIAKRIGFTSYTSFFREFKKAYGISPNDYRKNLLKKKNKKK